MREKILAHRIRWLIGLCTFLVLFGCSGFPIYNFTTGRQLGSWYFMLMLCIGYFEIGQLLGVLYSRNKVEISCPRPRYDAFGAGLPVFAGVW